MPLYTDLEFSTVFTYNGSTYTDVTLEAQSPLGTSFSVFGGEHLIIYLRP